MNDSTTAGSPSLVAEEVTELLKREARIAEDARIARETLAKDTDALKDLVRSRQATTGDRITDYFIAAHGILDDTEISKPLRKIQERMAGKTGELFLVALHESNQRTFGGPNFPRGRRDYHVETRHFLGVLSEEDIFLNTAARTSGLLAKKHLELSPDGRIIGHAGPFIFSNIAIYGPRPIAAYLRFGAEPNAAPTVEVLVGDAETLNYVPGEGPFSMGRNSWIVLRNRMIRAAGKEIPEAPEEVVAREKDQRIFVIELNKVHNMLVERMADPAKCKKDFDDVARRSLTDRILSDSRELGMEADLLVQLVLKEIHEVP